MGDRRLDSIRMLASACSTGNCQQSDHRPLRVSVLGSPPCRGVLGRTAALAARACDPVASAGDVRGRSAHRVRAGSPRGYPPSMDLFSDDPRAVPQSASSRRSRPSRRVGRPLPKIQRLALTRLAINRHAPHGTRPRFVVDAVPANRESRRIHLRTLPVRRDKGPRAPAAPRSRPQYHPAAA